MSFDHKPEDTPERDRIENAGGRVTPDGRVNGGLNLSRAIGDHAYKTNKSLPLQGMIHIIWYSLRASPHYKQWGAPYDAAENRIKRS